MVKAGEKGLRACTAAQMSSGCEYSEALSTPVLSTPSSSPPVMPCHPGLGVQY